jgi:hypothetical protein
LDVPIFNIWFSKEEKEKLMLGGRLSFKTLKFTLDRKAGIYNNREETKTGIRDLSTNQ